MNVSAKNVTVWIWSKILMIRNISISCITWCFFRIPFDPTSREILFDWWAGAWEIVDWILVVARSVHKHMLCLLLYLVQDFEIVVTFFLIACTLKIKPLAVWQGKRGGAQAIEDRRAAPAVMDKGQNSSLSKDQWDEAQSHLSWPLRVLLRVL